MAAAKNKPLFFAASDSKEGQAKRGLSWRKDNEKPRSRWFFVGFSRFAGEACLAFKP
jgi:hypothetical protein